VIEYFDDPSSITAEQLLGGFFEGWPSVPSPTLHLAHLRGAELAVVAVDTETNRVVGLVTALGDGALTAFIPMLEVLPEYRSRGIGSELMRRALTRLAGRYSIDLVCDDAVVGFYDRLGGRAGTAVMWRNRDAIAADQPLTRTGSEPGSPA
jgi:ribosomal protein S18 acetylase RimI-like enzyme